MTSRSFVLRIVLAISLALQAGPTIAASALFPSSEAGNEEAVEADPFGRETPRSTVTGLLRALASDELAAADPYLAPPEGSDVPAEMLAARLRGALDSGGTLQTFQELSNEAEGDLDDGLPPTVERVGFLADEETPILLTRSEGEDGQPVWQVASETLVALPDEVGNAPARSDLEIAGAPLWDWMKLFALLLLAFVIARGIAALILLGLRQVLSSKGGLYRLLDAALPPLALFVAIVTFRIWSDGTAISIVARQTVLRYLGIAGWIAALWFTLRLVDAFARWLSGRMERRERHQTASVITFARRVAKVALLVIATLGILDTLGFDVTTGVAALGIGGLVLALGAQKTVENLVGTISVLADRPIQVGDVCKVGDVIGTVEDIGMRSTRIRTLERTLVTIPNGDFSSRQIENYTKRERFLFNETIGLEYALSSAKLREAIDLIEAALIENPRIADDPRRAKLRYFGADSLSVETFAYIETSDFNESLTIRNDLLLDIYERLEAAGIAIAFPTRTVYLRREDEETGPG